MIVLAWITLAITFLHLYRAHLFFRKERIECQKYDFFQLRDDILWSVIQSKNKPPISPTYEKVNWALENFKGLGLNFFSDLLSHTLWEVFEEAKKNGFNDEVSFRKALKKRLPDEFYFQYLRLVLITARKNSILLRLAMTKLGTRVFVTWHVLKLSFKVKSRTENLHITAVAASQVQTIRCYSFLSLAASRA